MSMYRPDYNTILSKNQIIIKDESKLEEVTMEEVAKSELLTPFIIKGKQQIKINEEAEEFYVLLWTNDSETYQFGEIREEDLSYWYPINKVRETSEFGAKLLEGLQPEDGICLFELISVYKYNKELIDFNDLFNKDFIDLSLNSEQFGFDRDELSDLIDVAEEKRLNDDSEEEDEE